MSSTITPSYTPARGLTPTGTKVTGLFGFTARLTKARFASRQGESLLYLAAIFAFTISAGLALTVAGGTWMFFNRWQHPFGSVAGLVAENPEFDVLLQSYFVLAILACALLIPAIYSLASGAAVLGARGRERRLAALRLLGLSSTDVTRMSLIDTLLQATIGVVIGTVGYLATLPLWSNLEMIGMPLSATELLLPWPLLIVIDLVVIGLGIVSAWWGLRQVRISPLGVARRTSRPGLRAWRVVLFGIVLCAGAVFLGTFSLSVGVSGFLMLGGVILIMVQGFNIAGPWFLQQLSKLIALSPFPSVIWAARRIQANPKTTWQRVIGISLLSLIGGFVALMPISTAGGAEDPGANTFVSTVQWDYTKGVIITLAVGFALTAVSIFIAQASAVFERAEQTVAMYKMGAPLSFNTKVMWLETLGPLVFAVLLGSGLGTLMAYPVFRLASNVGVVSGEGPIVMAIVLVAGLGLAMIALAACQPLQRRVLAVQARAND
ncbi:MAG: ABC transporter permease [Propionibacterium sp.]|nr:ABC transporter permease [Propionibacterium sp.]